MGSDLISYLAREQLAEQEARYQKLLGEQEARYKEQLASGEIPGITYLTEREVRYIKQIAEARYIRKVECALERIISARFPDAPLRLANTIHRINHYDTLLRLIPDIVDAADLATVERDLAAAADEIANL